MRESAAPSQRRYRRLTVRVVVAIKSDRGLCREVATTLGAGGLFVATERPLSRGARVRLRFQLPGRETVHELEGRVVWTAPPSLRNPHAPGMGIQFDDRRGSARLARDLEAFARSPREDAPREDASG